MVSKLKQHLDASIGRLVVGGHAQLPRQALQSSRSWLSNSIGSAAAEPARLRCPTLSQSFIGLAATMKILRLRPRRNGRSTSHLVHWKPYSTWTDSAPWNLAPTAALRALNARMMPRNLTQHGKWNACEVCRDVLNSSPKGAPHQGAHSRKNVADQHRITSPARTSTAHTRTS